MQPSVRVGEETRRGKGRWFASGHDWFQRAHSTHLHIPGERSPRFHLSAQGQHPLTRNAARSFDP